MKVTKMGFVIAELARWLYDQTQMVPLVFWSRDMTHREAETQVRLVDIAPAILDLLGMPALEHCDGKSLVSAMLYGSPISSAPAYSETCYPREQDDASGGRLEWICDKQSIRIDNQLKVIMHIGSDMMEVYDLEGGPLKRDNLAVRKD